MRPQLERTEGFLGATIERVGGDRGIEIVVVTRWASVDAIHAFAGEDIGLAVVEAEARAKREAEEQARREAEEQARREAEEAAAREAEQDAAGTVASAEPQS